MPGKDDQHDLRFAAARSDSPEASEETCDDSADAICMVGAGRLATALALALTGTGFRLNRIVSRTVDSAGRLAGLVPGATAIELTGLERIPERITIISVTDDALDSLACRLAALPDWDRHTVLHTSGARSSDVLSPLREKGARVGSFHPVQTFAAAGVEAVGLFRHIPVAVEGDPDAVEAGFRIARRLGADPFHIDARSKTLFHAAAVVAGNFVVTLLALADEMAAQAGADERGRFNALVAQAIRNVAELGPVRALTGPVVRGDEGVLGAHLEALSARRPDLIPVYAALAGETIRLATREGELAGVAAEAMLDILDRSLAEYGDAQVPE